MVHLKVLFLESEAHWVKVVEEYRNSTLVKVEGSLTCKVGFGYMMRQLPSEIQTPSDYFKYPSWVSGSFDALRDIKMMGGGFVLSKDEDEDEDALEQPDGDSGLPPSLAPGATS
ncbi:uncharacterized protein A4U43_C03F23300 [Asparagus officinalis]|uniref:Uncharacterized protein n=1 Tax=Asparagus officinalis TaxID=4686 RepID=A0A5P1FCD2_ASPOF|nr:uncharacterized protein A4U43_C03F23300 [Asparagus officinalis]